MHGLLDAEMGTGTGRAVGVPLDSANRSWDPRRLPSDYDVMAHGAHRGARSTLSQYVTAQSHNQRTYPPYAPTRFVTGIEACAFYHTMEVPGFGLVKGQWDLRGREDAYLGGVDCNGQRVLEVGTASGFLCFHMEERGADVVAYDLSDDHDWDVVPFADDNHEQLLAERRRHIRALNDGWWLTHGARKSRARVVYGTVYEIPEAIGKVDIATFGAILLHVRDPFLALQNAAKLKPETIIVTESLSIKYSLSHIAAGKLHPGPIFLPNRQRGGPKETWWLLSPDLVKRMLGVLGYASCKVHYHRQLYESRMQPMFTVVATRG